MEIKHDPLKISWALSYKIPLKQSGVLRNGKQYYYHRFGWVLIPLKSGEHRLDIPKLKLDFGQYKVALPLYKFNVKSLPDYLNPDSLVGRLQIRLLSRPGVWLQHKNLYRFRFMVTAYGIPAQWLPATESWLRSKPYARYYIQRVRSKVTIDHLGLVTRLIVDAALIPRKTGEHNILRTHLKYFNAATSQWNNQLVLEGEWISLPAWLYWSVYVFIGLVIIYVLWVSGRYVSGLLNLWRRQSCIRKKVKCVESYVDLRLILCEILENYGINSKIPENEIYSSWLKLYGPNQDLRDNLDINSRQEFSSRNLKATIDLNEYKSRLLAMLSVYSILRCYRKTR